MRVLVAPQEFKGSLTARQAAEAVARGVVRGRPDWEVDLCPMSDGGPGFLDALSSATASELVAALCHDALGRPVEGRWLRLTGSGDAVVEAAEANGLWRLEARERDALRADTFGVGELVAAAVASGARRVLVGVGGSATTDGGAGMG